MGIKLRSQKNTIFDNEVTIFFRFQRKLEEKNYLFKNSCPEEITSPIPLDQSSLDHLFRPSLSPEIKRKKKGGVQRDILNLKRKTMRSLSVRIYVCLSVCLLFFSDNTVEVVMSSNLIGLKKSKRLQIKQF